MIVRVTGIFFLSLLKKPPMAKSPKAKSPKAKSPKAKSPKAKSAKLVAAKKREHAAKQHMQKLDKKYYQSAKLLVKEQKALEAARKSSPKAKSPKEKRESKKRIDKARKKVASAKKQISAVKHLRKAADQRLNKAEKAVAKADCKVHAGKGCGNFMLHSTRLRKVKHEGYGRTGPSKNSPTKKHITYNYRKINPRLALKSRVKHGKKMFNDTLKVNNLAFADTKKKFGERVVHQVPGRIGDNGDKIGYKQKGKKMVKVVTKKDKYGKEKEHTITSPYSPAKHKLYRTYFEERVAHHASQ